MASQIQIALLTGGQTAEREIALLSAQNVCKALESRVHVDLFDLPSDLDDFFRNRRRYACAIPVFHGKGGEDGTVQGFFETLGIPYIFSGVEAHAIGMDKAMTKTILAAQGIKTADWIVLKPGDAYSWQYPVVVKPLDQGSSVGVGLVRAQEEFASAHTKAFACSDHVLVERLVEGKEFTVAVVDHDGKSQALPVIEIRSKNAFFDFESKYDPALCDELCPAPIDEALAARLQEVALAAHKGIGARHLSRTDMIVDRDGETWFLEINTIPGLTSASLTPKAIAAAGLNLSDLLIEWIAEVTEKRP
ncbi:MAG: D-alanine--D-alanine ligase [Patescibacteria group bacterium]